MPYLIQNDFKKQIQLANMQQVIGSDYTIINSWLLAAQEKATSYLVQKYLTALEFTETAAWDGTQAYNAADRVYLDAPAFDPAATYDINDLVLYQGSIYSFGDNGRKIFPGVGEVDKTPPNNNPPGDPGQVTVNPVIFNPQQWTLLGTQYTIFYAAYPFPLFDVYGNYNTGDQVTWMNQVYTAAQPTAQPDSSCTLQYGSINNIPLNNYFPGSPQQDQWTPGGAYAVPPGTSITDTGYWTPGDNRSQQMVQTCINLVLYYAHQRISPMNIPNHIKDNYREAINWLQDAAAGAITPLLQKVQPSQGNMIRYGGDIRNINSY